MNLLKLARAGSVAEALQRARASVIVTVQPEWLTRADGRQQFRIPEAADYGGSLFTEA